MRRREIDDVVKQAFPAASAEQVESAAKRVLERLAHQPVSNAPETVLVLPEARKARWYWAAVAAAAAIVVIILVPIHQIHQNQNRQQEVRTREDVLLMQAIEADRSRIVPSSMERIMALLPKDEPAVTRRSQ
jgi:hypothetical protein